MKRFSFVFMFALFSFSVILAPASAQYWFQFGARGGSTSAYNNGVSATIQTVLPQTLQSGSIGFWVGEDLSNGAFIQIGYLIENQTNNYPSICNQTGCGGYEQLNAGDAEWFYEYFPPNYNNSFLGAVGPDGSAGENGALNNYSFYSVGNTWYFTFDGKIVGNVTLGTSVSSSMPPIAFGELANASAANTYINPVEFSNFSVFKNDIHTQVSSGYSYIGYGAGSATGIKNPYGVEEVDNKVNYFEVGSGLPQPQNGTQLWHVGYYLYVNSKYGNISSSTEYFASSTQTISSPAFVQINRTTRAIFEGWSGTGLGSYSGQLRTAVLQLNSNITETALWKIEYYINVSSQYGSTTGSGWYANGTTVQYSINPTLIQISNNERMVFSGWSSGNKSANSSVLVKGPESIHALWVKQYYLKVVSNEGNATGSGWYNYGSIANISVTEPIVNISNNTRYIFSGWSDGNKNASSRVLVNLAEIITANYNKQYLTLLVPTDAYGKVINAEQIYLNNIPVNKTLFLNATENYTVTKVDYNSVQILTNYTFIPRSPASIRLKLPIYNVNIGAKDIFGHIVNASLLLTFLNGTSEQAYTGNNGSILLKDVPYGYVNCTANYLGISQKAVAREGSNINFLFFSTFNIEVIVIGILIIAIAAFVVRYHYSEKERIAAYYAGRGNANVKGKTQ